LADGVVLHDEEVVLATDGRPDRDPTLILRVAAAAAQAGYPLSPPTVARLARESGPLPVPWPPEARDAFVSLLGAGPGLLPVWEALDRHRIIERWIPEWSTVRSAPQRNALHVYRVDRHLVQATAYAGEYVREVARPDLLLVGALLHDIGKGHDGDHSIVGADLARRISARMGFAQPDIEIIVALVRHHLVLPDLATRRDVEDPVTALAVVDAVGTPSVLDALHALCRADAQATGPAAWSEWKAALIRRLVEVARAWMSGDVPPEVPPVAERHAHLLTSTDLDVLLESASGASHVVVAVADRPGLLGTIAGVLALHRVEVKSAETRTLGERAVMVWTVVPHFGELPRLDLLRADIARGLDGSLDLSARMAARRDVHRSGAPPVIAWVSGAASEADVLEVRMHDEPGLLHRLGAGLAQAGVSIIAARVSTLGSEVVDAFYVQAPNGERLTPEAREHALAVLQGALTA
jgi:[protein-PII] uridylyltransferase